MLLGEPAEGEVDMAKKFTYKGKSVEELQSMPQDELMKILPARQRRDLRRGFNPYQKKFLARVKKAKNGENVKLRTHCRNLIILPEMIALTIEVYTGKEWQAVEIKPEMVGHYLGEFALTRRKVSHGMPGMGATRSSLYVPLK